MNAVVKSKSSRVEMVKDEFDSFNDLLMKSLELRCGLMTQNEIRHASHYDHDVYKPLNHLSNQLARLSGREDDHLLAQAGNLLRYASGGAQGSSNAISNIANRLQLHGFNNANEIWQKLSNQSALSSFKPEDRHQAAAVSALEKKSEKSGYQRGSVFSQTTQVEAQEYGSIFVLTRQMIINDDMSLFASTLKNAGAQASRTIGDKFANDLIANNNLKDGNAWFSGAHNNIGASAGSPSVITFGEMRKLIRRMKVTAKLGTAKTHLMNTPTRYVVVPAALENIANILVNSELLGGMADTAIEVLVDSRLDEVSETKWYIFSDPELLPCYEVSGLFNLPAPNVITEVNPETEALQIIVTLDFDGKVIDYRGCAINEGA